MNHIHMDLAWKLSHYVCMKKKFNRLLQNIVAEKKEEEMLICGANEKKILI